MQRYIFIGEAEDPSSTPYRKEFSKLEEAMLLSWNWEGGDSGKRHYIFYQDEGLYGQDLVIILSPDSNKYGLHDEIIRQLLSIEDEGRRIPPLSMPIYRIDFQELSKSSGEIFNGEICDD